MVSFPCILQHKTIKRIFTEKKLSSVLFSAENAVNRILVVLHAVLSNLLVHAHDNYVLFSKNIFYTTGQ